MRRTLYVVVDTTEFDRLGKVTDVEFTLRFEINPDADEWEVRRMFAVAADQAVARLFKSGNKEPAK